MSRSCKNCKWNNPEDCFTIKSCTTLVDGINSFCDDWCDDWDAQTDKEIKGVEGE